MSEHGHGESESMKAGRNAPPLPHERTHANDGGGGGSGSLSMAMPLLLSVGGALAAAAIGVMAEKNSGTLSRAAGRTRDEVEDWYDSARHQAGDLGDWGESFLSTGAKAAGVTGLLKALGSGKLSRSATTAAKALAAKKIAEYAASGGARATKSAGRFAKRHPAMTAGGTAAALKARSAYQEGSGRAHDAWSVLRHGRSSVQERESVGGQVATGVTLLALGATAMYLFHPDQGRHRRRVLREQLLGSGQRAASSLQHGYHTAQERAGDVYDTARQRASDAYHRVADKASNAAGQAADFASTVRNSDSDNAGADQ